MNTFVYKVPNQEMVNGQSMSYEHLDYPPHPSFSRTGSLAHFWGREVGYEPEEMIKGAKVVVSATEEGRAFVEPMIRRMLTGARERSLCREREGVRRMCR